MIAATADTRQAQRLCRTVSTALVSSTVTALKRMGAAVRAKYIKALKNNGSKDVGSLPAFNFFWWIRGQGYLNAPTRKPGGSMTETRNWRIDAPERGVVRLDIMGARRDRLARWQFGGGDRAERLRKWVRSIPTIPSLNRYYHGTLMPAGWPRWSELPPVPDQPVRDIVHPLRSAVTPLLGEWFDHALANILSGKAKSWTQTRFSSSASHRSSRRSSASGPVRDYARAKGRR